MHSQLFDRKPNLFLSVWGNRLEHNEEFFTKLCLQNLLALGNANAYSKSETRLGGTVHTAVRTLCWYASLLHSNDTRELPTLSVVNEQAISVF